MFHGTFNILLHTLTNLPSFYLLIMIFHLKLGCEAEEGYYTSCREEGGRLMGDDRLCHRIMECTHIVRKGGFNDWRVLNSSSGFKGLKSNQDYNSLIFKSCYGVFQSYIKFLVFVKYWFIIMSLHCNANVFSFYFQLPF